eukprot:UN19479
MFSPEKSDAFDYLSRDRINKTNSRCFKFCRSYLKNVIFWRHLNILLDHQMYQSCLSNVSEPFIPD